MGTCPSLSPGQSHGGGTGVALRGHRGDTEGTQRIQIPLRTSLCHFLAFSPLLLPVPQGFSSSSPEVSKFFPSPAQPVVGGEGKILGKIPGKTGSVIPWGFPSPSPTPQKLDLCPLMVGFPPGMEIPGDPVLPHPWNCPWVGLEGVSCPTHPKPFQDSGMFTRPIPRPSFQLQLSQATILLGHTGSDGKKDGKTSNGERRSGRAARTE